MRRFRLQRALRSGGLQEQERAARRRRLQRPKEHALPAARRRHDGLRAGPVAHQRRQAVQLDVSLRECSSGKDRRGPRLVSCPVLVVTLKGGAVGLNAF